MTFQAFEGNQKLSEHWVAVPLELVDWMAEKFPTPFLTYLARLDPYASQKVREEMVLAAASELSRVKEILRDPRQATGVPDRVDLFGVYGLAGAKKTVGEAIKFFEAAATNNWKVVSIGD